VHAVGGTTGAILTGVFAINEYGGTPGLIEGNAHQVVNQLIGVGIVIAYDAIVSLVILRIIDWKIGLRVSGDVEIEGLDLSLYGEAVQ
jgi:ammonium transporter, Amt family